MLKKNNNRRERKAQAGRQLTEKVKSVCAVVSSRQCVWVCEEGVTVWLTDWPTEAGRDERKVRRCQAELRNTHPTESTSTPWLNMDQRFSLCVWAWNKMRHFYHQVRFCLAQISFFSVCVCVRVCVKPERFHKLPGAWGEEMRWSTEEVVSTVTCLHLPDCARVWNQLSGILRLLKESLGSQLQMLEMTWHFFWGIINNKSNFMNELIYDYMSYLLIKSTSTPFSSQTFWCYSGSPSRIYEAPLPQNVPQYPSHTCGRRLLLIRKR